MPFTMMFLNEVRSHFKWNHMRGGQCATGKNSCSATQGLIGEQKIDKDSLSDSQFRNMSSSSCE